MVTLPMYIRVDSVSAFKSRSQIGTCSAFSVSVLEKVFCSGTQAVLACLAAVIILTADAEVLHCDSGYINLCVQSFCMLGIQLCNNMMCACVYDIITLCGSNNELSCFLVHCFR